MFGFLSKLRDFITSRNTTDIKGGSASIPVAYLRKQTLSATIIRACVNCGKPGIKDDKPVGPICPWCNAERPQNDDRGAIWQRIYS